MGTRTRPLNPLPVRLAPKKNFRCPFKYQGQYYDSEVELCYNRFRYYHPETGRYISEDPIKLLGGFNVFAYVKNTNWMLDIFGLSSDDIVVRGGTKPLAEGSGVTKKEGKLSGISVNVSEGKTKEELSEKIIHNQIATTTRGEIEATGATIKPAPSEKNPYHALINDIPEDKAEELFANKEKNPISKEKRYNNK